MSIMDGLPTVIEAEDAVRENRATPLDLFIMYGPMLDVAQRKKLKVVCDDFYRRGLEDCVNSLSSTFRPVIKAPMPSPDFIEWAKATLNTAGTTESERSLLIKACGKLGLFVTIRHRYEIEDGKTIKAPSIEELRTACGGILDNMAAYWCLSRISAVEGVESDLCFRNRIIDHARHHGR